MKKIKVAQSSFSMERKERKKIRKKRKKKIQVFVALKQITVSN